MEDEFDDQYADELDAMDDMGGYTSPKPRRSLHFATPKEKKLALSESDHLEPAPVELWDGTLARNSPLKRGRGDGFDSDEELKYDDDDDLNEAPSSKRRKTLDKEIEELWDDDSPTKDVPKEKPKLRDAIAATSYGQWQQMTERGDDIPPSPDKLTIDRILEYRNKGREVKTTTTNAETELETFADGLEAGPPRVFKRIPSEQYMATTDCQGNRVYMKVKEDKCIDEELRAVGKANNAANLLGTPLSVLREQLEEERRTKLLAESTRLREEVHRQLHDSDDDNDDDEEDKENRPPPAEVEGVKEVQKLLWVEKYAPRRYTELLSEETINRSLLHWLKLWDYTVFNKEVPVKNKGKEKKDANKMKFKKYHNNQQEEEEELDKFNRPVQKISLLCGPPGLGKTTLAHIIAKHAGYNVVEMNASDDRSAEVFKEKIEASTQMKAVLGADPRPNCLIIDEIDGAPQAAINVLLNLLKQSDGGESKKKKKNQEDGLLKRPVICICNDQYVPALRQLRRLAMILHFPQTDSAKLAGRLSEVARLEGLGADLNALLLLCEKTDNDVRSCLNTLQFIRQQCKEISVRTIQTVAVGQKDSHKSLFSVWSDVLTLPKPSRQRLTNIQDTGVKDLLNVSPSTRFSNILGVLQGAGEYDKLTQGLFENYLDCKFKDPYMEAVSLATDWLCHTDQTYQYIQHKQNYSLMPYLPFVSVLFHFLFASNQVNRLQYPSSQTECNTKKSKCDNVLVSMMSDMLPGTRKYVNFPIAVLEILPLLVDIIQPTFRPVNTQLYSAKEKEDLANLVQVMISYSLTYHQEKSFEGMYAYVLEPHVDEVVQFPGMKQHKQLTYASKQLVAREVQLEKMRKSEMARAPKVGPPSSTTDDSAAQKEKQQQAHAVPSHLQRLTAKPLEKTEEVQVKDFFGRVLKKTTPERSASNKDAPAKINILATDIWFHFHGGYSNAVRRNVKIKQLL